MAATPSPRSAGPADGEAIVALHGFPETSASYTPLLEAGADGGAVAPSFWLRILCCHRLLFAGIP